MVTNEVTSEEWHLVNVPVDAKIKIKNFANNNGRLDLGPALAAIMKRLEELETTLKKYEGASE